MLVIRQSLLFHDAGWGINHLINTTKCYYFKRAFTLYRLSLFPLIFFLHLAGQSALPIFDMFKLINHIFALN